MPLFGSMLMGGFECAAHKLHWGKRLDIIASTGHDARASEDFCLLQRHAMTGARDGLRWHLIEQRPGRYDWSSFLPVLRAARDTGMTVVWDLLHYGIPNGLDVFSARFLDRFAGFARAAAQVIAAETDAPPIFTPVNEISYWAYAGGDAGHLNPFERGRGDALKRQLVRAALAAGDAVRSVDRKARTACAEPLVYIRPTDGSAEAIARAHLHNDSQLEALARIIHRTGHSGLASVA